jgi:hypothetical protein
VIAVMSAAAPEVVVHQMTALAGRQRLRHPDKTFAATNELRARGTDNLLAAAAGAGTRRVIAQGYAGRPDKPPAAGRGKVPAAVARGPEKDQPADLGQGRTNHGCTPRG